MSNVIRFSEFQRIGPRDVATAGQRSAGALTPLPAVHQLETYSELPPREYIEKMAMRLFNIATEHKMPFLAYLLIMAVEEARGKK